MRVSHVELRDFRCYESEAFEFHPGVTVVVGDNGHGKTSLLEAVAWTALGRSFRGVPDHALVRHGCDQAIVRVEVESSGRCSSIDAELRGSGRSRVLVNHHPINRVRDLLGLLRVTIFAPDDLELVKGGPARRREYLDDLLVAVAPRYEAVRSDYERVLRHRNALLKGGVRDEEARTTLEVFDEQLVNAGAELVRGRLRLVERLNQPLDGAYQAVAADGARAVTSYETEWAEGDLCSTDSIPDILHAGLSARRRQEIDRGLTLVGPHRDDWRLGLAAGEAVFDSRTHASQGEQRSLALALRLAGHRLCTEVLDDPPVLLLDDVFSELDARRTEALVAHLPSGQTVLTTAGSLPPGVCPDQFLRVAAGSIGPG